MNGILGILLFLSFLTTTLLNALPYIDKWNLKSDAQDFRVQIEFLWDQIKAYQADRYNSGFLFNDLATFPATVDDMMPSYFVSCSMADNEARRCLRPDITPWGQIITIEREIVNVPLSAGGSGVNVPGMVIRIPFNGEPDEYRRNIYRSELAKLPNGTFDDHNQELVFKFGRIGSEVEHQALVRRDGTTTLTGEHWDTGGKTWITNVLGMSLRNVDGSQYSVASGLQNTFVVRSGSRIKKHSCPKGHTPTAVAVMHSNEPLSNANKYTAFTYVKPIVEGGVNDSFWTFKLNYKAKRERDGVWVPMSDGYLQVTTMCK